MLEAGIGTFRTLENAVQSRTQGVDGKGQLYASGRRQTEKEMRDQGGSMWVPMDLAVGLRSCNLLPQIDSLRRI